MSYSYKPAYRATSFFAGIGIALVKIIISVVAIAIASIPAGLFYAVWSWCMAQVPAVLYAGLIKIAISLALLVVGGGITFWLSVILFGLAVSIIAEICK